jgi:hypothetical protein
MASRKKPEECIQMLSNDAACAGGLWTNKKSHPHEYGWLVLGAGLLEKSGGSVKSPAGQEKLTVSRLFDAEYVVSTRRCRVTAAGKR